MPVGRGRADTGPARGFGEGETGGAFLGDKLERGADQRFLQIAVVIAARAAMFEAGIPPEADPSLRQVSERAFGVLRAATEKLLATMPGPNRPPALMVSLHIWALSHGVASLFGRGDAARRTLPMSPEELLEAGVLVYLRGLGFLDGGTPKG